MATTFDRRPSSVIKKTIGNEGEFTIDEVTVTVTSATQIGDVLRNNSGTWVLVDAANTANAAGVLVDERLRFGVGAGTGQVATGDITLQVARRAVIVDRDYLNYAADVDTTAEIAAAEAALLALGVKVVEGY